MLDISNFTFFFVRFPIYLESLQLLILRYLEQGIRQTHAFLVLTFTGQVRNTVSLQFTIIKRVLVSVWSAVKATGVRIIVGVIPSLITAVLKITRSIIEIPKLVAFYVWWPIGSSRIIWFVFIYKVMILVICIIFLTWGNVINRKEGVRFDVECPKEVLGALA